MARSFPVWRGTPALCWLVTLAASVAAQRSAVIQTETKLVLVDTIVTGKKGEFIRDLTAKDFRLWEDGREQTIQSAALNAGGASRMALFFDGVSLPGAKQAGLRPVLGRFIDAHAGPDHLMAIVNYDDGLQVSQTFTDNPGRLKAALNNANPFTGATAIDRNNAPAVMANLSSRSILAAVTTFAKDLENLPGRKSVILFSAGVPFLQKEQLNTVIEACNRSNVALYVVDSSDPASPGGSMDLSNNQRAPFSGQPNPGRNAPPDFSSAVSDPQTLLTLAHDTGGMVLNSTASLWDGLERIAQEESQYYVLSYAPPDSKIGSCHALRVKADRGGTTLRARSGYCTEKPLDLVTETSAVRDLENRAAAAQTGNLKASIQLPFFYLRPNVARVHLTMQLASAGLPPEIDVLGLATAADGSVAARFTDKVDLASPRYEKSFGIAAGQYTFTLVFSSGEKNFGKLEAPLAIDAYDPAKLAISGLALSRETTNAASVQSAPGVSLAGNQGALVAGGTRYIPSGSNQFAKGEPAFVYFEVYGQHVALANALVSVLDRSTGEVKERGTPVTVPNPGFEPLIRVGARIPIEGLDAGSYRLEVAAEDPAGGRTLRTIDFDVR